MRWAGILPYRLDGAHNLTQKCVYCFAFEQNFLNCWLIRFCFNTTVFSSYKGHRGEDSCRPRPIGGLPTIMIGVQSRAPTAAPLMTLGHVALPGRSEKLQHSAARVRFWPRNNRKAARTLGSCLAFPQPSSSLMSARQRCCWPKSDTSELRSRLLNSLAVIFFIFIRYYLFQNEVSSFTWIYYFNFI